MPQRRNLAVEWLTGDGTGELVGGGPSGGLGAKQSAPGVSASYQGQLVLGLDRRPRDMR